MRNGNLFDKFLDRYDAINQKNSRIETRRIIKKPKKLESILGFGASLIVLVILIRFIGFSTKGMFIVVLLFDLLFLAYYGVNLFTKNGFGLPATVQYLMPEEPQQYYEPEPEDYDDSDYESEDEDYENNEQEEEESEESNDDDDDDDYYRRVQRY